MIVFSVAQLSLLLLSTDAEFVLTIILVVVVIVAYFVVQLTIHNNSLTGYLFVGVAGVLLIAYYGFKIVRFAAADCPTCITQKKASLKEINTLNDLLRNCAPDFNATLSSDEANRSLQFQNLVIFGMVNIITVIVVFIIFVGFWCHQPGKKIMELCKRYAKELFSPVVFTMQRPKSVKNDMERGPQTPVVSKATEAVMDRWEGAKVSTQVASQTNNLPFDQGTIVIPSGRLPSVRSRPVGSSREGTLADDKALCRMSLTGAAEEADKSLALDKGSGAVAKSSAVMEETLGRSHNFCRCDIGQTEEIHYDLWTIQRWQNPKGRVVTPGNEVVVWRAVMSQMDNEIDSTFPRGEPKSVALCGSTTRASGI
eukprot:Em0014g343a